MLPGFDIGVQSGGNPAGAGGGLGPGQGSFSIAFDPITATVTRSARLPRLLMTPQVTAYPSGGTAPYTFAWVFQDGYDPFDITDPTNATTDFSATLEPGSDLVGTARVTVTDATGAQAFADLAVSFRLINNSGEVEP